jgi:hypothetical protein
MSSFVLQSITEVDVKSLQAGQLVVVEVDGNYHGIIIRDVTVGKVTVESAYKAVHGTKPPRKRRKKPTEKTEESEGYIDIPKKKARLLAERVRDAVAASGLGSVGFAEKYKFSPSMLSNICCGKLKRLTDRNRAFFRAAGVQYEDLLPTN